MRFDREHRAFRRSLILKNSRNSEARSIALRVSETILEEESKSAKGWRANLEALIRKIFKVSRGVSRAVLEIFKRAGLLFTVFFRKVENGMVWTVKLWRPILNLENVLKNGLKAELGLVMEIRDSDRWNFVNRVIAKRGYYAGRIVKLKHDSESLKIFEALEEAMV